MNDAIRAKALGYAAKTVLGAAFLTACSSGGSDATNDDTSTPTDDQIISQNAACKEGLAKLKEVFPDGDKSFWNHPKPDATLAADDNVTKCCDSMISGNASLSKIGKYRSVGCCAADRTHDEDAGNEEALTACTPWGPPVPPAMIA